MQRLKRFKSLIIRSITRDPTTPQKRNISKNKKQGVGHIWRKPPKIKVQPETEFKNFIRQGILAGV